MSSVVPGVNADSSGPALETELPQSKGKGLELALESEGAQELRRCNSCERRDAECICIKVSEVLLDVVNLLTTL